jgi:hypothetical protein
MIRVRHRLRRSRVASYAAFAKKYAFPCRPKAFGCVNEPSLTITLRKEARWSSLGETPNGLNAEATLPNSVETVNTIFASRLFRLPKRSHAQAPSWGNARNSCRDWFCGSSLLATHGRGGGVGRGRGVTSGVALGVGVGDGVPVAVGVGGGGRGAGVTRVTVKLTVLTTVQVLKVARNIGKYVSAVVGLPKITPVFVFTVNPGGSCVAL